MYRISLSFKLFFVFTLFQVVVNPLNCFAQESASAANQPKLFTDYTNYFFQEKVFVHHDKDSYLAGETMWMRGYRMDASTLSPYVYSGVMYMELRNSDNRLMHRMQIIKTDSCFQASYKIPQGWASGDYELIAYTNWMRNYPEDYYYKKRFYIYNASDNNVVSKISYTPVPDKDQIAVTVKINNVDGDSYQGTTVDIIPYVNGRKDTELVRNINRDSEFTFNIKKSSEVTGLQVNFQNDKPHKYERHFNVPVFTDDIDVQFMPEGGHLLAGVAQQVGFKAVGSDGKGIDVSGRIKDSDGNMVGPFSSMHLGMGRFAFQPAAGMSYTAEVTTQNGRVFEFPLPEVAENGVGISTAIRAGTLTCRIYGTEGYDFTGLSFVAHSRGRPVSWTALTGAANVQLPVNNLPEGILHCFIVDGKGEVYSERIVLINKDLSPDVKVDGLRATYGRREKVELDFQVLYGNGQGLPSEFSVAVLDTRNTVIDNNDNIVSNLLLTSDLNGRIEKPSYYFDKSVPLAERDMKADLLMMTQGWKRYDVGGIFRGEVPNTNFTLELGQSIAGRIKPLWGKVTDTGALSVFGIKEGKHILTSVVEADSVGNFHLSGIAYPANTTFVIQGSQKGGRKNVEVIMEEHNFIDITPDRLAGRTVYSPEADVVDEMSNFYQSRGMRYIYENGERVYALEAVTVTARANSTPEQEMYDDFASNKINGSKLAEDGYSDIRDWLESVGIVIMEDPETMQETAYIRNNPVMVVIDQIPYSSYDMLRLPVSEIEDIWVMRDPVAFATAAMLADVQMNQSGIIIHTKGGMGLGATGPKQTTSFQHFSPLGYSTPEKFYVPKYDGTDNKTNYDERVTVHWEPNVKTDLAGKANIWFYTTDIATEYTMVIQGIGGAKTGYPFYKEVKINAGK